MNRKINFKENLRTLNANRRAIRVTLETNRLAGCLENVSRVTRIGRTVNTYSSLPH